MGMNGELRFVIYSMEHLKRAFSEASQALTGDCFVLTLQREREKRRSAQNRRYWAVLHEIAEQLNINDVEAWHEWAKRRFIGVKEVSLPDGEIVAVGKSSTELSVKEFADYMTSIEAWAVDQGVIFNDLPE
jgi:hypothetical protein